jgi:8-oxo-dGTP diphosphatase
VEVADTEEVACFCLRCGSALRLQTNDGGDLPRWTCPCCGWVWYNNPRPCVGALIVRHGRVLLARRLSEPFAGWWDIPGGFMEAGETPQEAVAREVAEETGLQVRRSEFLAAFPDRYGGGGPPTLNLHYLVEAEDGVPLAASDVSDVSWFLPDDLPECIAFENGRLALMEWQARQRKGCRC